MSKTIILMRHGEADEASSDYARPLSTRGRAQCLATAGRLRAAGVVVDRLLYSSATRTAQSAQLVAQSLGAQDKLEADETLYLAEASRYLAALRSSASDVSTVLLIAHNPGLSQLASALRGRHTALSTAGYALVRRELSDWRELCTA